MNESFMFIFLFTVLALGKKCARFVQFIHVSFTELVNLNGFMNMLIRWRKLRIHYTNLHTHTHFICMCM